MQRKCVICGQIFQTVSSREICCTDECKKKRQKWRDRNRRTIPKKEKPCKNCGKTIFGHDAKQFCDAKCSFEYRKNNVYDTRECQTCGKKFTATFKEKKFCSKECSNKRNEIKCEDCGEIFLGNNAKNCPACRRRKYNKKSEIQRRMRIKENGNINWDISVNKLYKKSKGKCAICGGKCDLNNYHYDNKGTFIAGNMYPSIDHMIPLSKGGTHTWDNVQLAHRHCNSIKNDSFVEKNNGQFSFF